MARGWSGRVRAVSLALGFPLLLAGCASARWALEPKDLRHELADRLGAERAAQIPIPFEPTPELRELAVRMTHGATTPGTRLETLALSLSDPAGLHLRYAPEVTRAADETLAKGGGDCLSLTGLFIAMARSLDLQVYFIDARGIQEFGQDGSMLIDRRHVVAGFGRPPVFTMIDFDKVNAGNVQYRVLTDLQALARYLNNFGVDDLRAGRNEDAIGKFQQALAIDPGFAAAHNNLALALSRTGKDTEAEQHLAAALQIEPGYSAALLNLVRMLERNGRTFEAEKLRSVASNLRLRDPVWRYRIGLEALRTHDLDHAIEHLRMATTLDPAMVDAWFTLAQAYEERGDRRRAIRAADRVLAFLPDHAGAKKLKARLENS